MREHNKELISKKVMNKVAKTFGIDTAKRLKSLDDFELLKLVNRFAYPILDRDGIFTDIKGIIELWKHDFYWVEVAIRFGDGDECFKPDNWLFIDKRAHVRAIPPDDRRDFMLYHLCKLNISKGELLEALEE